MPQDKPNTVGQSGARRVGGERRVAVARDNGYRDGSGVTHLIKRLETEAAQDPSPARKLENLSCVKS